MACNAVLPTELSCTRDGVSALVCREVLCTTRWFCGQRLKLYNLMAFAYSVCVSPGGLPSPAARYRHSHCRSASSPYHRFRYRSCRQHRSATAPTSCTLDTQNEFENSDPADIRLFVCGFGYVGLRLALSMRKCGGALAQRIHTVPRGLGPFPRSRSDSRRCRVNSDREHVLNMRPTAKEIAERWCPVLQGRKRTLPS